MNDSSLDPNVTPSPVRLHTFCLGDWMTNCYLLAVGDRCWIVDAGFNPEPMLETIKSEGLTPSAVILTHAHVDHIAGLWDVRNAYPNLPIAVHEAEAGFLNDSALNLSIALDQPVVAPEPDTLLKHGQVLTLGSESFELRHCPGHSPGGLSIVHHDSQLVIAGDALFNGSIGRVDFPTSNGEQLLTSIHEQLLTLPDEYRVMPGHGPETTIGRERQSNPFLNPAFTAEQLRAG